jgi:hypothetical protein
MPLQSVSLQLFLPLLNFASDIFQLESWRILVELLLVKPSALLEKESAMQDLSFQDQQLAALHALQVDCLLSFV